MFQILSHCILINRHMEHSCATFYVFVVIHVLFSSTTCIYISDQIVCVFLRIEQNAAIQFSALDIGH